MNLDKRVGEVVCENGLKQVGIGEREKYREVRLFMSGGGEEEFGGEEGMLMN
ncbi:hypothetical protein [Bacillus altitudinis]|uniref:hypothetical protein n=1 Tax=Bacillus altitudinis TaxID=293387 RepID=UPI0016437C49|nr:hypothetical protein [Bacillus altitudinis]